MHEIYPPIKCFEQNPHGCDYVVGDVHGCFDQLDAALKSLNFDPEHDRCFAVGDLVDRGPHSEQALEWLAKPWFYCCLGNHEETLLEMNVQSESARAWLESYGGEWWLNLSDDQREVFCSAFRQLPMLIEIDCKHGKVGIVHAEVPKGMDWQQFRNYLIAGDMDVRKQALWGRRRIRSILPNSIRGIDRVVSGHTITPHHKIKTIGNQWFIDTGAFVSDHGHLTVLSLGDLFK